MRDYEGLLCIFDIIGAAREQPKQHTHAQIAMAVAVLTPLDDYVSALAQDHGPVLRDCQNMVEKKIRLRN